MLAAFCVPPGLGLSRGLSVGPPFGNPFQETGKVNGQAVVMLFDTGCTQTLVHAKLVPQSRYLKDQTISVQFADGRRATVPLATVHVECSMAAGDFVVGILETLPADILLGNDIVEFAYACETRAQRKVREQKETMGEQQTKESGVIPTGIEGIRDLGPIGRREVTELQ